jgi:hypothetical protein
MAYKQEQDNQKQQEQFVGPTLCISRTHKHTRKERIFAVLRQLNLGWIGKIDLVPKEIVERNPDGTMTKREFVRVFVHFTKWFPNHQTHQFLDRLDTEGFVHIVYDEPRFWKITKYVKPQAQSRYPRPRIDFGANGTVQKTSSPSSSAAPIVPVQVTRKLQSVSASSHIESESKKKYWKQQAEIATAVTMHNHNHCSLSPTPRSHGSDSESSPSPVIQRNVRARLFDE